MNVLKIVAVLSLMVSAAPSFADAPRVGEDQVKTGEEKENTQELVQEKQAEKKIEKKRTKKRLARARKDMAGDKQEAKSSGVK